MKIMKNILYITILCFLIFSCDFDLANQNSIIEENNISGLRENYFGTFRFRFHDSNELKGDGYYYCFSVNHVDGENWYNKKIKFRKEKNKLTISFIDENENDLIYFYKLLNNKKKTLYLGSDRYEEIKYDEAILMVNEWHKVNE